MNTASDTIYRNACKVTWQFGVISINIFFLCVCLQLTVRIRHAPAMATAPRERAFARKAGKDWTAPPWTKTHCNVCPTALVMVHSIWMHRPAHANQNGVVTIVQRVWGHLVRRFHCISPYIKFRCFFPDSSTELCDLDCGKHGRCVGESCTCDDGWGGDYCNTKLCDSRCNEHGQCKNGTCLCVTGWNGRHCTIEGCPAGCSSHGSCRVSGEGLWECRCYDGWDGPDCAVALEQNCGDNKDNDKGMFTID